MRTLATIHVQLIFIVSIHCTWYCYIRTFIQVYTVHFCMFLLYSSPTPFLPFLLNTYNFYEPILKIFYIYLFIVCVCVGMYVYVWVCMCRCVQTEAKEQHSQAGSHFTIWSLSSKLRSGLAARAFAR